MNIFRYAADLMFPPKCIYCGKLLKPETRPFICENCMDNIPCEHNNCAKCGGKLNMIDGRPVCTTCRTAGRYFDASLASADYDGAVREAVAEFKFRYRMYMSASLAYFLADKLKQLGINKENIDYVTGVPCDIARTKQRGFDSAGLLAKETAAALGIPYKTGVLEKIHSTRSQRGLDANERAKNVKGAYKAAKPDDIKGKSILLVDDIITTGSTITETSRILKRSGAKYVFAATVAKA